MEDLEGPEALEAPGDPGGLEGPGAILFHLFLELLAGMEEPELSEELEEPEEQEAPDGDRFPHFLEAL